MHRLARFGLLTLSAGCRQATALEGPSPEGKLHARPRRPPHPVPAGSRVLNLAEGSRDGLLFVPAMYGADTPAPLAVLFHGASMDAASILEPLRSHAEASSLVLLAIDSRAYSWDAIIGPFGTDVAFVDQALAWTFDRVNIDAARVSFAGFSDGASYALTMGLINGDLVSRIAAFSPGYIVRRKTVGQPSICITHGRDDPLLSAENTREFLVPTLREDGYAVSFQEFAGRHQLPPEVMRSDIVAWMSATR